MKRNARNKNRRPQASKRKIDAIGQAEIDRARSSAGSPHTLKTAYTRKPKHPKKEW